MWDDRLEEKIPEKYSEKKPQKLTEGKKNPALWNNMEKNQD